MPLHRDIIASIERVAPLSLQERWDNSGWQVGDPEKECQGVLLAVETTESTVQEAIACGANLLITHHPILFHPLKRVSTHTYQERVVALAIKHDIAIYAAHTSVDNASLGINRLLADRLGLQHTRSLVPLSGQLYKLVVMLPPEALEGVERALSLSGAGRLGAYDHCSFRTSGIGCFRPLEGANPYSGIVGEIHRSDEFALQVLVPQEHLSAVLKALYEAHPYEEPAFDIIPLANKNPHVGTGIVGELIEPISEKDLLACLKDFEKVERVAYSQPLCKKIKRIALCGGSGGSFLSNAIASGADAYITGEAKYNDFLDAQGQILLATIGHFESESIFCSFCEENILANFANFVVRIAKSDFNPVNYL